MKITKEQRTVVAALIGGGHNVQLEALLPGLRKLYALADVDFTPEQCEAAQILAEDWSARRDGDKNPAAALMGVIASSGAPAPASKAKK
jgi:hypothetical protein